jgi:hypothetical protein
VAVVQQAAANVLLPKYQAALSQDGAEFGPLTLTEKGIRREDGKLLAWEKVGKAGVGNGALWWESAKGKMNSVSLADVPNSLLLISFVATLLGDRWKA